jgi:hypothetical protein
MPDFTKGRTLFHAGVEVDRVFTGGEEAQFIFGKGTQIFPNLPVPIYGCCAARMTQEADADWFEMGFSVDMSDMGGALVGNSAAGWTDAGSYLKIEVERSDDLDNWSMGQFLPAPVPVVDLGDGKFEYWSRAVVPRLWHDIMIDLTATSDRHGKSITAIKVFDAVLPLNYPYTQTEITDGTLQADLRNASLGNIPGATVSVATGPLRATGRWHAEGSGGKYLYVTMVGSNVTDVKLSGSTLAIDYPYSMPSQHAALQADLTAACGGGTNNLAVIQLHSDAWTITLPDLATTGAQRSLIVYLDPGDPFPYWDMFGYYVGLNPGNDIAGSFGNLRAPDGAPLQERNRQFARLKISAGSRYDAYL